VSERPAERLSELIRAQARKRPAAIDLGPSSTYEAVTRQMVNDLVREIGELRRRIDALFYVVISAIIVDVLGRLFAGVWA
jgi:hypothetical protein